MKKSRLREVSIEVTVGAVVFMILLVLSVFTIILSRDSMFKEFWPVTVKFETVMGLSTGDNILTRGVIVGMVTDIEVVNDGVIVNGKLRKNIILHDDYGVRIKSSSVLGGHYLELHPGTRAAAEISDETCLVGTPPVDIMDDASQTIAMLKESLDEGGILANLEVAVKNIGEASVGLKEVSDRLATGQGTLGRLINSDEIYMEMQNLVANLQQISKDLEDGQGTIGKLLKDDELYTSANELLRDLKVVSGRLSAGEGTVGKLLSDDSLYEKLDLVADDLHVVLGRMRDGEGTLGRLSSDAELYDQVVDLVDEARATLDDLRETSPIVSFSSIFFGAF